jgi:hypothetical protein
MNTYSRIIFKHLATAIWLASGLFWINLGSVSAVQANGEFPDPVPAVKTYEYSVSSAREPEPALKYRLLVPLDERIPGNAAAYYKRAIMTLLASGRVDAEVAAWNDLPLEKLPLDEVRRFIAKEQSVFDDIKLASRCDTCDWGIRLQDLRKRSVIEVRLIEFQEARSLTRLLSLRARFEIAERRFDDAIITLGQSYQLARDLATVPSVIANLVALSMCAVNGEVLGELISMDGAPNLYWALRSMPDPLVDTFAAAQLESTMAIRVFPFLKDAETVHRTNEEWVQLLADAVELTDSMNGPPQWGSRLKFMAMMQKSYPVAKQQLIAAGYDSQKVEQMPVGQVIAIYARICHEHVTSENLKWMSLPFHQRYDRQKQTYQELIDQEYLSENRKSYPARDPLMINSELNVVFTQIAQASNRQRVLIAGFATVEAIRMQAAHLDGRLPQSLDEISVVPVPINPSTGKLPLYRIVEQRADLLFPLTDAQDHFSGRRFLVKIR